MTVSAVWCRRPPSCTATPSTPPALSSWKRWSATSNLSIWPSRYSQLMKDSVCLFTFLSFDLILFFPPSDVVPGHQQGAQQASGLHCGYQDTQPAVWQRRWHVPRHWNTGGCQQQPICIIYVTRIVIYYLIHLPAAAAFSPEAFCLWTLKTLFTNKISLSAPFSFIAIAIRLARGSTKQVKKKCWRCYRS